MKLLRCAIHCTLAGTVGFFFGRLISKWPGMGGVVVTAIFILLLNVPYILIQRYNRPRLMRLQTKLEARNEKKEGIVCVC